MLSHSFNIPVNVLPLPLHSSTSLPCIFVVSQPPILATFKNMLIFHKFSCPLVTELFGAIAWEYKDVDISLNHLHIYSWSTWSDYDQYWIQSSYGDVGFCCVCEDGFYWKYSDTSSSCSFPLKDLAVIQFISLADGYIVESKIISNFLWGWAWYTCH